MKTKATKGWKTAAHKDLEKAMGYFTGGQDINNGHKINERWKDRLETN